MNIEQLKERMRDFINTDYKAYKFEMQGEIIGNVFLKGALTG
jgi:hypothetical protein